MYEKKTDGAGRNIQNAYIRPFKKEGIVPFAVSFVLSMIPFIQILVPSIAYSEEPGRLNGGVGKRVNMSFKMLVLMLLMFAPSMVFYLIVYILNSVLCVGPGFLIYIFLGIMLFLAVSALVRFPMALAALSKGRSMREALDANFVKLLISANFGEYVLYVLCLFPLVVLSLFMDLMPLWLSFVYGAFLTALMFFYLGYVMNRCYDKAAGILGLGNAVLPYGNGSYGRYARSAVSVILIVSMAAHSADAFAFTEDEMLASGNYPKNQYTGEEYNEALEKFTRNGELNKGTKMYYDSDTGRFYCAAKPSLNDDLQNAVVDFGLDMVPVVSNIKNAIEFIQYKKIADDPSRSDAERAAAKRMQYLKFVAGALPFAGSMAKVASAVTGKGVVPFLIVKAGTSLSDPTIVKILGATDDAIWSWERVGNAYKITKAIDKKVGDQFGPYSPDVILGESAGSQIPEATQPMQPGNETTQGMKEVTPGDFSPFWGTYTGRLESSYGEAAGSYGAKVTLPTPEITIKLDKDGYMSLSYTFKADMTFDSQYGISMSSSASLPVNVSNAYMTRTLAGYMGEFSASDLTGTTVTQYLGEAYEGGGGEVVTTTQYSVSGSVVFSMVEINGEVHTVASGTITQTAFAEGMASQSMVMTFDITK
ncbi:MAG: hypothetical protein VB120_08630 [Lachnospiraceae bacterium]|nr:hypothetical protein [Lachnospiraceae bacterium]